MRTPGIIGTRILVGKSPFHGDRRYPTLVFPRQQKTVLPTGCLVSRFHDGQLVDGYDEYEVRGSAGSWVFARMRPWRDPRPKRMPTSPASLSRWRASFPAEGQGKRSGTQ